MDADSYHRAADLPSVRGSTLPRGRALTTGELRALFGARATDSTAAGARDAALLALLYGAGLRRAERAAELLHVPYRSAAAR
jgi:integrase/recombinase XerD